ncbi:MAG: sensor histidine kinase [Flammeovirgaceae bacterium]
MAAWQDPKNFAIWLAILMGLILVMSSSIILLIRLYYRRQLEAQQAIANMEINYQKQLIKETIATQEKEREQIAIRLHDDIGNKLNVLAVWLNNPNTWNSERSKALVSKQLPELIEATRNISHSLYPVNLERFGFIQCLEELALNIEDSLTVHLVTNEAYKPKPLEVEVQLYRVIQEFISNVLKHAHADTLLIQVRDSCNALSIVLADDGKGFNPATISRGMGLNNIELRLKTLVALFKWKNSTQHGSRLLIQIPNHEHPN